MSRPSDLLIEWTMDRFKQGLIDPITYVPLYDKPHKWTAWSLLKGIPQFEDIVHECITAIPWEEKKHPVGVMLQLQYPMVYEQGWNGVFWDICGMGFIPLLVRGFVEPQNPTLEEMASARVLNERPKRDTFTHMIVPTETDAVVVAAMLNIFTPND